MALALLLSLVLNVYLCWRVWALAPLIGNEKILSHFLSPLLPPPNVVSLQVLQDDCEFGEELKKIVEKYSTLAFNYTSTFWGVVDDYKQFQVEFVGDSRNLAIFTETLRRLLIQRIYTLTGFNALAFAYSSEMAENRYIVKILFAMSTVEEEKLQKFVKRDKDSHMPQNPVLKDNALDEEFKKNGV